MSVAKINYGGKEYNITDNVYSEEEHIVGVWTDGKPLYRTVVRVPVPATSNGVEVVTDFTFGENVEYSFVEHCHMIDGINERYIIPYFNYKSDQVHIRCELILQNNGNAYIINSVGAWSTGCTVVASILYTKTTD